MRELGTLAIVAACAACGRLDYEILDAGPDPCEPPPGVCVWTSAVSSSASDPANWSQCAGGVPQPGDRVFIDARVSPIEIDAPMEILGFAGNPECFASVFLDDTLVVGDPDATFTGSVGFYGTSPTCTTCVVRVPTYATIRDGGYVKLGPGATLLLGDHQRLEIGTPDSQGHFSTVGGLDRPIEEWPRLSSPEAADPAHYGMRVRGPVDRRSSIALAGLVVVQPHTRDAADAAVVDIGPNVDVWGVDHVQIESYYDDFEVGVRISDCAGVTLHDTTWSDVRFVYRMPVAGDDYNVEVLCDPGARIQMEASGTGAGESFERDPNDVVDW